jgi:hypothetical protein
MKAIRFGKLKNSTINDLVVMLGEINPNSKVYLSTERPAKQAHEYTIEELTTLLLMAKHNKLAEDARTLQQNNPELFEFIKGIGECESMMPDRDDVY